MVRRSAGLLLYRVSGARVEVLLGHMGGPLWSRRDERAWTIPKGEHGADEQPLAAARREFTEELGLPVPPGDLVELTPVRQSGAKLVSAWALAADLDPASVVPGTFELEWPPRSGRVQQFPELDRVEWFALDVAREKIVAGQAGLLDQLAALVPGD